jgi:hypothetical protein
MDDATHGAVLTAVHARIPMPTQDDHQTVQLDRCCCRVMPPAFQSRRPGGAILRFSAIEPPKPMHLIDLCASE